MEHSPPPTLSQALVRPRFGLSVLELCATFGAFAAVFGGQPEILRITSTALVPLSLLLAAQGFVERRRSVRPVEALCARVLAGGSDADRAALAEALVVFPRDAIRARFLGWIVTAVLVLAALSRHPDVDRDDLIAAGGLLAAASLLFLLLRAWTFRHAAEQAILPALSGADPQRYLGRTLRERLFLSVYVPASIAGVLTAVFHFVYLELGRDRIRGLLGTVPAIGLTTGVVFFLLMRRASAPLRAWLIAPAAAPSDTRRALFTAETKTALPGVFEALQAATALPWTMTGWTVASWLFAGIVLGVEHAAWHGTLREGVLILIGMITTGLSASLVQLGWSREILQPAREACAEALGVVPLTQLRPRLGVRVRFTITTLAIVFGAFAFAFSTLDQQQRSAAAAVAARDAGEGLEALGPRLAGASDAELARLAGDDVIVRIDGGRVAWMSRPIQVAKEAAQELAKGVPDVILRQERRTLAVRDIAGRRLGLARAWPAQGGIYGPASLVLLFLALLALSTYLALAAARDFTRPLLRLREFARRLGQGELDAPLPVPDPDEVGELGLALDHMRSDLRRQLATVRDLNASLERKVAERTTDLERALVELRRTQAQVVHVEKMASIGRLSAGVAHEVNNPLNFIANSLTPLEATLQEALQAAASGNQQGAGEAAAEITTLLKLLRNGVERTRRIVRGLGDFARSDEGEPLRETDVTQLFEETVALLAHELKDRITVVRRYDPQSTITCRRGSLEQVLMNLVANAAQAISGPGTITLGTKRTGEVLELSVADTGRGIPDDVLPKIFEPFFTTKDVGQGTGLGLSIAHGIVERHGGRFEVRTKVGEGTTFTVTLPVRSGPERK